MKTFLKALLLEDSIEDAKFTEIALRQQFNLSLVVAKNRDEFIDKLTDDVYDVILADFKLPKFNGMEALSISQQLGLEAPFIVISGSLTPKQQTQFLESGVSDIIDKSDLSRLPYVIRRAISDQNNQRRLKQTLVQLKRALHEKDVLVAEVHHRVKNNLAVVSGLLELSKIQRELDEKTEDLLNDNILRVKSIALVHESLYQDKEMTDVNLNSLISEILFHTKEFHSRTRPLITVDESLKDVQINIRQAVPLGLIVTELVTNAMKHAFDEFTEGNISVHATLAEQLVIVTVKDNGKGLPENYNQRKGRTFGTMLIKQLVSQLSAELFINSEENKGSEFIIKFERIRPKNSSSSLDATIDSALPNIDSYRYKDLRA